MVCIHSLLPHDPDHEPSDSDLEPESALLNSWNYYYHLPNDKDWTLSSYKIIMSDMNSLEKLVGLNEAVTDSIIKNCMLFVMRDGITPVWEDPSNRTGGCFSYKVLNKVVASVWREMTYLLCGGSLTIDHAHMSVINGITISPKHGFCIIKIWTRDCTLQDPAAIAPIQHLTRAGCLFKAHVPEY